MLKQMVNAIAYTIEGCQSFRLHDLSRFAYIKVVSPTLRSRNIFWKVDENHFL